MQKESVAEILSKALAKKKINLKIQEILERIEIPPSSEMGDFAFPCFFLASKLKRNPADIALEIREEIEKIPPEFQDIQTKGPYINFFVNRGNLAADVIKEILEKKDNFGSKGIGKGKKMLVEHTSINPNASPHVGRARNAIIGDSLVRILKFQGFNVDTHYYVNDVSKQIAMLVLAGAEKLKFESMLKKYVKISAEIKKSKKKEQQVFDLLEKFESGDKETTKKFNKVTSTCVKGQE
ncbi:MAG TPA: arginine--tRNA ligase, partial [Candidatus Pacearchaeota archaeon]|nr:arginine--tRNA ligase [Candidatus Pacearchaeota archaeon]